MTKDEYLEIIKPILKTMGGEDGGISFIRLRELMYEGNMELNAIVINFSKLCTVIQEDNG